MKRYLNNLAAGLAGAFGMALLAFLMYALSFVFIFMFTYVIPGCLLLGAFIFTIGPLLGYRVHLTRNTLTINGDRL